MDMIRFNDFYLRLYRANLKQDGQALLLELYALWREAETSGVEADTLADEARNCLHRVASTDLFVLAACEWIGDKGHLRLSKALVHEVSVQYLQHPKLVRFVLSSATESSTCAVALRLCALNVPVPVSLGWVLSLNEDLPSSPLISATTSVVTNFWRQSTRPLANVSLKQSPHRLLSQLPPCTWAKGYSPKAAPWTLCPTSRSYRWHRKCDGASATFAGMRIGR